MSEDNKIRDTVEAVKGIVEAVPVYQDAIQPAAKQVGVALETVAKTLHVLLAPVSGLVWGYDKIKVFVNERVAEKLKDTPPERLKSPEANVAGPALEALRFTGYQEQLRELYANLLATAIDSKTAHAAHPSFVEMIKQMSPDEALIMTSFAGDHARPFLDVRREEKTSNVGTWFVKYFSNIAVEAGCKYPDLATTYLVNLQRLGLVELRENYTLQPESQFYGALKEAPLIKALVVGLNNSPDAKATIIPGTVMRTPLGGQFCEACINAGTHK